MNDYLASDKHQHIGGLKTWERLASDYHSEGKHLYILNPDGLTKVTPTDIASSRDKIWGEADSFENIRLIVSHRELL